MQVLNTYVKSDSGSHRMLLIALTTLLIVVIYLLKDDITRFLEHHTIGAAFYSLMDDVWKFLVGAVLLVFIILNFTAPGLHEKHIFVEATIKENYPIGPLYEKYEIIEKRGEIWVLEQRPTWQEAVVNTDKEEVEE